MTKDVRGEWFIADNEPLLRNAYLPNSLTTQPSPHQPHPCESHFVLFYRIFLNMPYSWRLAYVETFMAVCSTAGERAMAEEKEKLVALAAKQSASWDVEVQPADTVPVVSGDSFMLSDIDGLEMTIRREGLAAELGPRIMGCYEGTVSKRSVRNKVVFLLLARFGVAYVGSCAPVVTLLTGHDTTFYKTFEHTDTLRQTLRDAVKSVYKTEPDNYVRLSLVSTGKEGHLGKSLHSNGLSKKDDTWLRGT
jgi:hypothetical protein